jgi:platelet-activating factor acetylhydrolase
VLTTFPVTKMDSIRRAASSKMEHTVNKPDDVPCSKQPNSRPPTGLREKLTGSPLPYYSGPYSVGLMDIEVPAREPRALSDIKRDERHLLQLETVLFTIYYPSGFGSEQGKSPEGEKKWSRATGYSISESRCEQFPFPSLDLSSCCYSLSCG